jgi:hypothetical protein
MRAALEAQVNKTDRNDARGIAQMMRAGLYRAGRPGQRRPAACINGRVSLTDERG